MPPVQQSLSSRIGDESSKRMPLRAVRFARVFLNFWLLLFLSMQKCGEADNFCFDGSREGKRLNSSVIEYMDATSGVDCIYKCFQKESCRSINFRKCSVGEKTKNCELLSAVDSEKPELLYDDKDFDHYVLLQPDRKAPVPSSSTPQITQKSSTTATSTPKNTVTPDTKATLTPTIEQPLPNSCKELLERNASLPNGTYTLRNNVSGEKYQVYCQMTEIKGCGPGGWTLVIKMNGDKPTFKYDSSKWTNNKTYKVDDGLEGLTKKETKLASFWNTPFKKICLGMTDISYKDTIKWIEIDHTNKSFYNVVAGGSFAVTEVGKKKWKSLITNNNPILQEACDKEGFNNRDDGGEINIRIGIMAASNNNSCDDYDSSIGFGASVFRSYNSERKTCGGFRDIPQGGKIVARFGYILVR